MIYPPIGSQHSENLMKILSLGLLIVSFAAEAKLLSSPAPESNVCTDKTQTSMVDYFTDIKDKRRCNIRVVITDKDEVLPLQEIEINHSDIHKRLQWEVGSPTVKVDGKNIIASRVAIAQDSCKQGNTTYRGFLDPISCKSDHSFYQFDDWKNFSSGYKRFLDPHLRKAKNSCEKKISSALRSEVEDFIRKNGGTVISFKELYKQTELQSLRSFWLGDRGPYYEVDTSLNDSFLDWTRFEVELMNKGKKIRLNILYPIEDNTTVRYDTPERDVFGMFNDHSERAGVVNVSLSTVQAGWREPEYNQHMKSDEALLVNHDNKSVVHKLKLRHLPCQEEVLINQNQQTGIAVDDSGRANSKADISVGKQAPVKKNSGATKQ